MEHAAEESREREREREGASLPIRNRRGDYHNPAGAVLTARGRGRETRRLRRRERNFSKPDAATAAESAVVG